VACADDAIFASNTSTSITEIVGSAGTRGWHTVTSAVDEVDRDVAIILTSEEAFRLRGGQGFSRFGLNGQPGFHSSLPFNNDAIRAVEAGAADVDKAIRLVSAQDGTPN
jgi:3-hydroxybutyryl-CoA dehydrogenase